MKAQSLPGLATLLCLIAGPLALAQDTPSSEPPETQDTDKSASKDAVASPDRPRRDGKRGGRQHPTRGHGHGRNRPVFADIDQDANGSISAREFEAFRSARISERKQAGKPMKNMATPASFEELDENGDGIVDAAEFRAHQQERQRRGVDENDRR